MNVARLCSSVLRQVSVRPVLVSKMMPRPSNARMFSAGNHIFEIDSVEDFTEKVINSPVPVLVDFHADWCGPCRVLGPRLEEKVRGRDGEVLMAKVNVDYAGELATDYGISAVPTVMSFKNGEQVGQFQGVIQDEEIDGFIDQLVNH